MSFIFSWCCIIRPLCFLISSSIVLNTFSYWARFHEHRCLFFVLRGWKELRDEATEMYIEIVVATFLFLSRVMKEDKRKIKNDDLESLDENWMRLWPFGLLKKMGYLWVIKPTHHVLLCWSFRCNADLDLVTSAKPLDNTLQLDEQVMLVYVPPDC